MYYWQIEASGLVEFPIALEIRSRTDPDYREVYDRYRSVGQAVEFMQFREAEDYLGEGLEGAEPYDGPAPAFETIKTTAPSRIISTEPEIECEMI